jgi:hypothetical protein
LNLAEDLPVKRSLILATCVALLSLLSTSCGTGDKIGSVSITAAGASGGTINLQGLGGTLQLTVTANYTSGKQINETNFATYTITPEGTLDDEVTPLPTPPLGVTLNATGMLTAVDPGICTWYNEAPTIQSPSWFFTGDYKVVATYRGFQSNPIYIPVSSAASDQSQNNGQCGP